MPLDPLIGAACSSARRPRSLRSAQRHAARRPRHGSSRCGNRRLRRRLRRRLLRSMLVFGVAGRPRSAALLGGVVLPQRRAARARRPARTAAARVDRDLLRYPDPPHVPTTKPLARNLRSAPGRSHLSAVRRVPRRRPTCATTSVYARAERDPEGVLGRLRRRARVVDAVDDGARLEAAAREVVRRRHAQRQRQLRRPPRRAARAATRRRSSGKASRATAAR